MKSILQIAWRNLWRTPKRTWITVLSIMFAMFFAVQFHLLKDGFFKHLIQSVVKTYSGTLQIHKKGYWDDKTIDNIFEYTDSIKQIKKIYKDDIEAFSTRLESFALVVSDSISKGAMVLGMDIKKSSLLTPYISPKMIKGGFFDSSSTSSVIIGSKFANTLEVDLNDTIILLSQGYHGTTATGKYHVQGICDLPSPNLNRSVVFMPLATAEEFYSAPNKASSLIINLRSLNDLQEFKHKLSTYLSTQQYEIMTWEEILDEFLQLKKTDDSAIFVISFILYMVIGFGVFGTMLMMVNERKREFSIMIAVGMKRGKLLLITTIEIFIITIIGGLLSTVLSVPIIFYFTENPIQITGDVREMLLEFGFEPILPIFFDITSYLMQFVGIFIIVLLSSIYPLIKTYNLKIAKEIQGK